MQVKYACFKKNHSKRIPERGPGQSSGIESCAIEFTDAKYRMHVAGALLVVQANEGSAKFAYPMSDVEYVIPSDEQGAKK